MRIEEERFTAPRRYSGSSSPCARACSPCCGGLLAEQESHGYQLVVRIPQAGLPDVAEGTVYPALARLEPNADHLIDRSFAVARR